MSDMAKLLDRISLAGPAHQDPEEKKAEEPVRKMESHVLSVPSSPKVPPLGFYLHFKGHSPEHLKLIHTELRKKAAHGLIWLAGDSSLDNKYWVRKWVEAPWQYENILDPPRSRPDVCYWLNKTLPDGWAAINCAVEASTLADRAGDTLLEQDAFLQEHMQVHDVLIVSVGGNDLIMKPTPWTFFHLLAVWLTPVWLLKYHPSFWALVRILKGQVADYIQKLKKGALFPRTLVCTPYFPCTKPDPMSWAGKLLEKSGYDRNPKHTQAVMRLLYEHATKQIPNVTPVPLFKVLDANNPDHYVARVEPSAEGGALMAKHFCELLEHPDVMYRDC
jgi:lysophospholipase L1-like esterase